MRPFDEVVKDLTSAISNVESKKDALTQTNMRADAMIAEANKLKMEANKEFDVAQDAAMNLRKEMEEYLNMFVPTSQRDRVRQSSN